MKYLLALLMLTSPCYAADRALILNDQEQAALRVILDAAIKSQGLNGVSRNAFFLSDKLDAAGIVTESKPVPPAEPKKEGE